MVAPREPRGRRAAPSQSHRSKGSSHKSPTPAKGVGAKRESRPPRDERSDDRAGPKTWGSVARRGAGRLNDDRPPGPSEAFREAAGLPADERRPEIWVRVDDALR